MHITKGLYGPSITLLVGVRSKREIEITTNIEEQTINICATGNITTLDAVKLISAIQAAVTEMENTTS